MTDQAEATRLTWNGPDTHVQIASSHHRVWQQAWTTDVPGLVIFHDAAHDLWTITHKESGKAVVKVRVPMVDMLRGMAKALDNHDWTQQEANLTDEQRQAAHSLQGDAQHRLGEGWGVISL